MDSFYAPVITVCGTVIVGYLANFTAERYRRFSDGSAIAAAISGELSSHAVSIPLIKDMLTGLIVAAESGSSPILRPWEPPNDPVYEEMVGKIGLLGIELVEDVVFTYQQIRAFRMALKVVHDHHDMSPHELSARLKRCLETITRAEERGVPLVHRLRERSQEVYKIKLPYWGEYVLKKR
ncbi:hypothetical protein [Herbaspirillum sp. CF444]|uniref:hypothetical protein n=1 Tax=Herbaspirillum sp. CF444 TaxID=1144319 RepID=UPI0012FBCA50|nr:hypothetical protein [Herbaspirillum sp. CF444]